MSKTQDEPKFNEVKRKRAHYRLSRHEKMKTARKWPPYVLLLIVIIIIPSVIAGAGQLASDVTDNSSNTNNDTNDNDNNGSNEEEATDQLEEQEQEQESETTYQMDLTFVSIDGSNIRLADHQGKVVILYFYDLDCPPCGPEADILSDIDQTYSSNQLYIVPITIHYWDSDQGLNDFATQHGLNYRIVRDDSSYTIASYFDISYTPTVIILDQDGNVKSRLVGIDQGSYNNIKSIIDGLI